MNNLEDENDEEFISLDIKVIENNIPKYNSKKLCEMIVCNRYFGSYKDIAVMCMKELSKRREMGDIFDFENYIESSYNELPQLNLTLPNIQDTLQQIISKGKIL